MKNIHLGERCFIIGNGPSLLKTDLIKLNNETTFSCNMVYKLIDKNWNPYYYFAHDPKYVKELSSEIKKVPCKKRFIGFIFGKPRVL